MDGFDARNRRPWTIEAATIELTKQVGDLAKHVMVAEQYYLPDRDDDPAYATTKAELADELADLLLAIIRIADHYAIDLEQAHVQTRQRELEYLRRFDSVRTEGGDADADGDDLGV
jgi:NTP pyrophosphatase (non-canonical NTP hydrolase)